ncbi:endonuclease/exonuclease/phosphatase family metal-dependent hydrolase [Cellulosimicrobium cellulans J34]|nr:endonuclease/exonuclease/phosphatase family metal-dependent hydrolase [Cellulosimicrobium cellulans J34]TWG78118.1 endonuclease/exonuclease/phosphatase family metal-dependent hydrolase [Cellulosimicrobium cellulans J34]SMF53092.1 Metal-dependent hydrolase, endonuclease/exonuclease/phosphatase family [Cellulosimicrobium cellulans J1]
MPTDTAPSPLPPRPEGALRLATFNTLHGAALDGTVDVERFARAVAHLDADVLALQEVERDSPRSGRADLVAVAADALRAEHRHLSPTLRGVGGAWVRAARPGSGVRRVRGVASYGIGLVSRLPVTRWSRLELDRMPWRSRVRRREPGTATGAARLVPLRVVPDEPRAALAAAVTTPWGPLRVVTTHTTSRPEFTAEQLRSFVRSCAGLPRPLVLLGDLNLRAPEPAEITGFASLADVLTHPSDRPVRQIDHVLADARPGGARVRALGPATAVDTGLSDHRAVVVDVVVDPPTLRGA